MIDVSIVSVDGKKKSPYHLKVKQFGSWYRAKLYFFFFLLVVSEIEKTN